MSLPKNDPYAKVVNSLDELVTAHLGTRVEVAFYPKLDAPEDKLKIFERIVTDDKSFNIDFTQKLDDPKSVQYQFSGAEGAYSYQGKSLNKWRCAFELYLMFNFKIPIFQAKKFIIWALGEMSIHAGILTKLKREHRLYEDHTVVVSMRSSQYSAKVARSRNVMAYHRDRQNYTLMKYYLGPSTRYLPRSTFASLPKYMSNIGMLASGVQASLTPCEYALENGGVCVHKGQNMPYVKTFHRAPEPGDCENPRGFLVAWLSWG